MNVAPKRTFAIISLCRRRPMNGSAEPDQPVAYWARLDQEAVAVLDVGELVARAPACGAPHQACRSSP